MRIARERGRRRAAAGRPAAPGTCSETTSARASSSSSPSALDAARARRAPARRVVRERRAPKSGARQLGRAGGRCGPGRRCPSVSVDGRRRAARRERSPSRRRARAGRGTGRCRTRRERHRERRRRHLLGGGVGHVGDPAPCAAAAVEVDVVDADGDRRDDRAARERREDLRRDRGCRRRAAPSALRRRRDDLAPASSPPRRAPRSRPPRAGPRPAVGERPRVRCRRRPRASADAAARRQVSRDCQPLVQCTRFRRAAQGRRCLHARGPATNRHAVLPHRQQRGPRGDACDGRRAAAAASLAGASRARLDARLLPRRRSSCSGSTRSARSTSSRSTSSGAGRSTTTAASSTSSTCARSCAASSCRPCATARLPRHRLPRGALDRPPRGARSRRSRWSLVMIPFWSSFVVRTYALVNLLADGGPLATLISWLHLGDDSPGHPLLVDGDRDRHRLLVPAADDPAAVRGARADRPEPAARRRTTSGASRWRAFRRVILPLAAPGHHRRLHPRRRAGDRRVRDPGDPRRREDADARQRHRRPVPQGRRLPVRLGAWRCR